MDMRHVIRLTVMPALLVGALALAGGCSSSSTASTTTSNGNQVPAVRPAPANASSPASNRATVNVQGMQFGPSDVTIDVGGTVTWTFGDAPIPHTVSFDDGSASSPTMASGTWSRTFTKAGTYTYHCAIHPNMTGTVTVR